MSRAIKFIQLYFDFLLSKKLCIEFCFPYRLAFREKMCTSANMQSQSPYRYTSHYTFKICILVYSSVLGIWLAWVTSRHTENTSVSLKGLRCRPRQPYEACANRAETKRGKKEVTAGFGFVPSGEKKDLRLIYYFTHKPKQWLGLPSPSPDSPLKTYTARSSLGIQGSIAIHFNLIHPHKNVRGALYSNPYDSSNQPVSLACPATI